MVTNSDRRVFTGFSRFLPSKTMETSPSMPMREIVDKLSKLVISFYNFLCFEQTRGAGQEHTTRPKVKLVATDFSGLMYFFIH